MTEAPPAVEVLGMTKRFGDLLALDGVSLALAPGSFHAVLGENGAGKSTLVKCIMGYHRPDAGRVLVGGREWAIGNPRQAHRLGFGMVYQHFTLVPSMTVAENLVLGAEDLPAVIRWDEERAKIDAFQRRMPFAIDPARPVATLAAGEKQKLEILKQLFLGRRILILDEPTSVLTPDEADQILKAMRELTEEHRLTVVLITHKFREALGFAREVTVLRAGRRVGGGLVKDLTRDDLARMMIGSASIPDPAARQATASRAIGLEVESLNVLNDKGTVAVRDASLRVHAGEIVGVAGVSGNGQRELVEVLARQREPASGAIRVGGAVYARTRAEMRRHRVFVLTDEPLRNACVRTMSVAENLAFRNFDDRRNTIGGWLVSRRALRAQARALIERYRIRTPGPQARLETLSGGNVQRTVLARELSEDVAVLIAQNPCAGLDFAATAEIRARIMGARNAGAAVLLISEDLDELLELADRIVVMFEGRLVHETSRETADAHTIGHYMASQP
ncbi:MAG: ABC transporter ATP-binding protein [Candidatus Rokubacteria bacterium 13_1_40CM_69_27]|nr:MAG: ABC transporter ATP-binding protein [Candidatus Rokubacteria bacterium 13_1_40CM_69_27]